MNRTIWSTTEILRSFDLAMGDKDVMLALAQMMADLLGTTSTIVTGFAATPDAPADLSINLAAGALYQLAPTDATADGAIPQDLTNILQQGIVAGQKITLTAPSTAGQSQWNLIQAQFSQADIVRANDPNSGSPAFYNSANPDSPNFNSVNTERSNTVVVQVIKGASATTGSEVPPNPTSGWVPLYLIDLSNGQTQITAGEIVTAGPAAGTNVPANYPRAPFLDGLVNKGQYALDVGVANAYVVELSPQITSYKNGLMVRFKAVHANTSGSTLDAGGGAVSLLRSDGAAIQAGDISAGQVVSAIYDSPSGHFYCTEMLRSQATPAYAADTGSANVYAVTLAPALTAHTVGLPILVKIAHTNTSTAVTFNPGPSAQIVLTPAGDTPPIGSLQAGSVYEFIWNGTNYQVIPSPVTETWVPTDQSGAGLTLTVNDASYIKIGKMVTVVFCITYPSTANGGSAAFSLPVQPAITFGIDQIFPVVNGSHSLAALAVALNNSGTNASCSFVSATNVTSAVVNSALSAQTIAGSFTYLAK